MVAGSEPNGSGVGAYIIAGLEPQPQQREVINLASCIPRPS